MAKTIKELIKKAQDDDRVEDLLTAIHEFLHDYIPMKINEKVSERSITIKTDVQGTIKDIEFIEFHDKNEVKLCLKYAEELLFTEQNSKKIVQSIIFTSEKVDRFKKVNDWFQILPIQSEELNNCNIYPLILQFTTEDISNSTIALTHKLNNLETIIEFLNISTEIYFYYEFYNAHNLLKLFDFEDKPVRKWLKDLKKLNNKEIVEFTEVQNEQEVEQIKLDNLENPAYIESFLFQKNKSPKPLLMRKFQNASYWYSKSIELYEINFSLSFIALLFALEGLIFEFIKQCEECRNPEMEGFPNTCKKCGLPKYLINKKIRQLLDYFGVDSTESKKLYNKVSNKRTIIVHQANKLIMDTRKYHDFPSQILMLEDRKDYDKLKALVKNILYQWILNKDNATNKFLEEYIAGSKI